MFRGNLRHVAHHSTRLFRLNVRYTAALRAVLVGSKQPTACSQRYPLSFGKQAYLVMVVPQCKLFLENIPAQKPWVNVVVQAHRACTRAPTSKDRHTHIHTPYTTHRTSSLASTRTTPDLAKNPFSKSFETTSSFFWSSPPAFCPPPVATPVAPAIAARCTSIDMPLQDASKAANSGTISSSP